MRDAGEVTRDRLRAEARRRGLSTELVLSRWVAERFLHRMSLSPHARRLTLKGAWLFAAWEGDLLRSTVDVDLRAAAEDAEFAGELVLDVASVTPPQDDGVRYETQGASFQRMSAGGRPGLRIAMTAHVGQARKRLKVDLGFGQPVRPGPEVRQFPSLLPGHPSFPVSAYPRETVVAEKLAIAVEFGRDNTRLRDYWDLRFMAARYRFQAHVLADAVGATFADREAGRMLERRDGYWEGAFDGSYARSQPRSAWEAWLREHSPVETPSLEETVAAVSRFASPLLVALRDGSRFDGRWSFRQGWTRAECPGQPPEQLGLPLSAGHRI